MRGMAKKSQQEFASAFASVRDAFGERSIEHAIIDMLKTLGIDDLRQDIRAGGESGRADSVSRRFKIVLEAKDKGKVGPDKEGRRKGESQIDQLDRYVAGLAVDGDMFVDPELPWLGFLTDGNEWWAWTWDADGKNRQELPALQATRNSAEIHRWLIDITKDRENALRPPPQHLTEIITDERRENLALIQEGCDGKNFYDTKCELWRRTLLGSGMVTEKPRSLHSHGLFHRHTLITVTSRLLISALEGGSKKPQDAIGQGFASWMMGTTAGRAWAESLHKEFNQYQTWRWTTRDILRDAYEELIAVEDRKQFGEHFTPNWLAEAICERVMDDAWCAKAIKGGTGGVLDPACGSGTFLFVAAKRLDGFLVKAGVAKIARANRIAELVHGMDIHPVAAEMSAATLMMAMPTTPKGGRRSLRIYQGDSMQIHGGDELFDKPESSGDIVVKTPKGEKIVLGKRFMAQKNFADAVSNVVEKANSLASRYDSSGYRGGGEERALIKKLADVIRKEGNGIWEWYLKNIIAPTRLADMKVDRIVANPPWVALNHMTDSARQNQIKQQMVDLELWAGGKDASRADIASVFVHRCLELYASKQTHSGWVLPFAALKADNWAKFRARPPNGRLEWSSMWDLLKVKKQPFAGAHSCIFFDVGGSGKAMRENYIVSGVSAKSVWAEIRNKFDSRIAKDFPQTESDYRKCWREGAATRPLVLAVGSYKGSTFTTYKSRHAPYSELTPLNAPRLDRRLTLPVRRASALIPFHVLNVPDRLLWPFDKNGSPQAAFPKIWRDASERWKEHRKARSAGILEDNLNHLGKLRKQLPLDNRRAARRVAYNKSGGWLCASRLGYSRFFKLDVVLHDSLHYAEFESEEETSYITVILNADALQDAFKDAQKSDRDYANHIWSVIPIPRFDSKNETHQRLASLCRQAEAIVGEVVKKTEDNDIYDSDASHAKQRNQVREILRKDGIMANIDAQVKILLPHHAS